MVDKKSSHIVFLLPYPEGIAPGQRFRFEQYLNILLSAGYTYELLCFLNLETHLILYKKGHTFSKLIGVLRGYLKRIVHLFKAINADYIFIYREATPLGPPIIEFILARIFEKKIIYDFDDAIWIPAISKQNKLAALLKNAEKVSKICKWAYKLSLGNAYLCKNAERFRGRKDGIVLNPTTIDTIDMHNKIKSVKKEGTLIVGWTGTHSTLPYMDMLLPVLEEVYRQHPFTLRIICNQEPQWNFPELEFVPWNTVTGIDDLFALDIGLMPLEADAWSEGKCGFKALQYMALGIPAIASPVGVNNDIVSHGDNGYLCSTLAEWKECLLLLLQNTELRDRIGQNARKTVVDRYSVVSNIDNFLNLFS